MAWAPIVLTAVQGIQGILSKRIGDKTLMAEFERDIQLEMEKVNIALIELKADKIELQKELALAQSRVVTAEVASNNILASSWRPIAMLNFLVLLNLYFFGVIPENFPESMAIKLFDVIQFGLGGYIAFRSLEKITPSVLQAGANSIMTLSGKHPQPSITRSEILDTDLLTIDAEDDDAVAATVNENKVRRLRKFRPGRK